MFHAREISKHRWRCRVVTLYVSLWQGGLVLTPVERERRVYYRVGRT